MKARTGGWYGAARPIGGDALMFGQCCLCDVHERPPVAVCCRCGAFVCREHVYRLAHRAPRRPMGIASTPGEPMTRIEMVCEVCYLINLAVRVSARKRAV